MMIISNLRTRIAQMQHEYYDVRQHSIGDTQDLEGWRISRLMRDARTTLQLNEADRRLRLWVDGLGLHAEPLAV